jgi:hypothetical protein
MVTYQLFFGLSLIVPWPCRGKESFETHVWMLKTFLMDQHVDESNEKSDLLLYIIAASVKKINHRLTAIPLSQSYFKCLTELKTFNWQPMESEDYKEDKDKPFIDIIPSLVKNAKTNIPNLQQTASLPWPFHIYNENTCIEFHLLLVELLTSFKKNVGKLKTFYDTKQNPQGRQADFQEVLGVLEKVFVFGRYLRTMAISFAMEVHLSVISSHLLVNAKEEMVWVPTFTDGEEQDFLDFQALKLFSIRKGITLSRAWESYRDWLRLMVHYFEAARVLASYVKQHTSSLPGNSHHIPIKILSLPRPKGRMSVWTELLKDERIFPARRGKPSGEDYIKFLQCGYESLDLPKKLPNTASKWDHFYKSLKDGPLKRGEGFSGAYHCEAYIASLLVFMELASEDKHSFGQQSADMPAPNLEQVEQMKALLAELQASNVFMHHLNLADLNDRVAGIPSECLNDAAQCVLTYSLC